jgi:hypothetical protein
MLRSLELNAGRATIECVPPGAASALSFSPIPEPFGLSPE